MVFGQARKVLEYDDMDFLLPDSVTTRTATPPGIRDAGGIVPGADATTADFGDALRAAGLRQGSGDDVVHALCEHLGVVHARLGIRFERNRIVDDESNVCGLGPQPALRHDPPRADDRQRHNREPRQIGRAHV